MDGKFDLILVGASFASSFFLLEYLKHASPKARVLVLERGPMRTHAWQVKNRDTGLRGLASGNIVSKNPQKQWVSTIAFGGNSNCWWGCTPRCLPNDFRLKSEYGVGRDWPLSYEELEPFYSEAEEIMQIAGPSEDSPFKRSRKYPLPPHRLNEPEKLLKKAFPDQFFVMPSARPSVQTKNRPRCCANAVCNLCPIDSKFSVLNELNDLYADPRVTLEVECRVLKVETTGDVARGVLYEKEGAEKSATAEVVALGANALWNPYLLLSSGITHPVLGQGLHEQVSVGIEVNLRGVDGFGGSTSLGGHGYMLYDGPRRKDRSAVLLETSNIPVLRDGRGKWRQVLRLKAILEDLPQEDNRVIVARDDPRKVETIYGRHSDYAQRALDTLRKDLEPVLAALPVESVEIDAKPARTEYHILGTTPMGSDPKDSIVDRHLVHHRIRNLLVLGSGVYPTSSPANPTLTLSALSLWAARHLVAAA